MAYEAVKLKSQTAASTLDLPVLVSMRGDKSLSAWNSLSFVVIMISSKGSGRFVGIPQTFFSSLTQIPTIHAVHPQISVARHCSVVWKFLWGVSSNPARIARPALLHTCIPLSACLCAYSTRTCGNGVTLRSSRGKKGKNIKVKAILVQVFFWVFSTTKC